MDEGPKEDTPCLCVDVPLTWWKKCLRFLPLCRARSRTQRGHALSLRRCATDLVEEAFDVTGEIAAFVQGVVCSCYPTRAITGVFVGSPEVKIRHSVLFCEAGLEEDTRCLYGGCATDFGGGAFDVTAEICAGADYRFVRSYYPTRAITGVFVGSLEVEIRHLFCSAVCIQDGVICSEVCMYSYGDL
ncbi:hypothetical protein CEXT_433371 [Caerostris extrusa]|uniref:Uncharacterized protein n=1 Tax=Caerostris extrusa TaxID=172846 RepID=A0AAV4UVI7_CAEEX|nr:hypothetical protein CEXT_433371 [Caerostris extrusa]